MEQNLKPRWFIVHTYSGHENKVAKTLMQRVDAMGFKERILEVLVPTKEVVKVRSGKKETVKEKIFAGYIFVRMILDDESWLLVRTTPGVTSFVGAQNKPTPVRDEEVEAIVKVVVSIFGRETPVELDFLQVSKI